MKYNPYSFSRIGSFLQCPNKFKLSYIDKVKCVEPTGLALYRGSYMHERIEHGYKNIDFSTNSVFTQKEKDACDEVLKNFATSVIGKYYFNQPGQHEVEFGIKLGVKTLELCSYNDPDAMWRGKIDFNFINHNEHVMEVDSLNDIPDEYEVVTILES